MFSLSSPSTNLPSVRLVASSTWRPYSLLPPAERRSLGLVQRHRDQHKSEHRPEKPRHSTSSSTSTSTSTSEHPRSTDTWCVRTLPRALLA
jgi:hypothetical protein